jgi:hypothetical protein
MSAKPNPPKGREIEVIGAVSGMDVPIFTWNDFLAILARRVFV